MGIVRYKLYAMTLRVHNDIFEVHEVKLEDDTRPLAMLDVGLRLTRHWSDRGHDIRHVLLPYWDADADVEEQLTVTLNEVLVHTVEADDERGLFQPKPLDVSEVVTSQLPPKPERISGEHEPAVKPLRVIRPHRQSGPIEGEGA